MNNKKTIMILIYILVLMIIAVLVSLILPTKKIIELSEYKYSSIEDFKAAKFKQAISSAVDQKQKYFTVEITEEDITEILNLALRESISNSSSTEKIEKIQAEIKNKSIFIYANTKVLGFIPSQLALEIIPKIVDNKLVFVAESAKLGHIPFNTRTVLKKIKTSESLVTDLDKGYLILGVDLPDMLTFKNIEVKDEAILLQVEVTVKSLLDGIKGILDYFK